ncbi:MAG TPA: SpoIIE family protein phosphatase [Blastocatellia bacterium]|nr:SpoIIE family protein phosphatase [Blastocatellia bacterium]
MLPGSILNKKTRLVWIALLALSPLAYVAGSSLTFKYDPNLQVGFTIDRQSTIEAARRFAASRGIDVTGWEPLCRVSATNDLLFYYRLDKGRESQIARSLAPEVVVSVRLRSPDNLESLEVELGHDGRLLGYTRNFARQREFGAIAEPAARQIALENLKSRLSQLLPQEGVPSNVDLKLEERAETGAVNRKYVWEWPLSTIPELTVKSELSFRGNVLTSDTVKANIDDAFARSNLNTKSNLKTVFSIAYGLLIALVIIFGIYRFVQRVKQKEISYSRFTMVTVVFATTMLLYFLPTDEAFYNFAGQQDFQGPRTFILVFIYISITVTYAVMGVFMGLAYGSGEGDIRESYPGKLTSLDALVTGRIFSQNVCRAILIGCAIGGWMLLVGNMTLLPWQGKPGYGEDLQWFTFIQWFGHLTWMSTMMTAGLDVITVTIIGLLITLPFLHRRFSSRRVIITMAGICAWLACTGPGYLNFRPWTALLLTAAVRAFFFLFAFLYFDLIAAIVCLAAPTTFSVILQMLAQPSHGIRESGYISLTITSVSLLIAFIFAFKGRVYREDEVRPLYAKLLADRISMQAEVSAAREAQKRLMPESLPNIPNFSIAACCHPAHEVGGDFYDVFKLEEDKLGILIAEGGGKGLGSALSIAFAKGYLMPKILGDSQSDNSPTEVIRGLQDRLTTMLDEDAGVGFAYVVIDDGTLRYARVGTHPVIMVSNEKSPGQLSFPEEREIKFKSGRRAEADISVIEGSYQLGKGDSVAMLTDGIVKYLKSDKTNPDAELSKLLINAGRNDSASLQEELDKSVKELSKRARKRAMDDDLTVVIVKLNNDGD